MAAELVRVRNLRKRYLRRSGWRCGGAVVALDGVDLAIDAGTTLALVGESGSGKSTLARCLACLEAADEGDVEVEGRSVVRLAGPALRALRRQIQLIFQDSATALNPRLSAGEIVEEPLLIQRRGSGPDRRLRVLELLDRVGLAASFEHRRPLELSGGQRQRLAIARALAVEARLLILDEAFAGLDVSSQAQIVNLLLELQAAHGLGYLLISHDLGLVGAVADEVAVLDQGRIVERGAAEEVMAAPQHPRTRALVAAIPVLPA